MLRLVTYSLRTGRVSTDSTRFLFFSTLFCFFVSSANKENITSSVLNVNVDRVSCPVTRHSWPLVSVCLELWTIGNFVKKATALDSLTALLSHCLSSLLEQPGCHLVTFQSNVFMRHARSTDMFDFHDTHWSPNTLLSRSSFLLPVSFFVLGTYIVHILAPQNWTRCSELCCWNILVSRKSQAFGETFASWPTTDSPRLKQGWHDGYFKNSC